MAYSRRQSLLQPSAAGDVERARGVVATALATVVRSGQFTRSVPVEGTISWQPVSSVSSKTRTLRPGPLRQQRGENEPVAGRLVAGRRSPFGRRVGVGAAVAQLPPLLASPAPAGLRRAEPGSAAAAGPPPRPQPFPAESLQVPSRRCRLGMAPSSSIPWSCSSRPVFISGLMAALFHIICLKHSNRIVRSPHSSPNYPVLNRCFGSAMKFQY